MQMEENMHRAVKRDATREEMFYFRKSLVPDSHYETGATDGSTSKEPAATADATKSHDHEYTLMSIDTIMNGKVL